MRVRCSITTSRLLIFHSLIIANDDRTRRRNIALGIYSNWFTIFIVDYLSLTSGAGSFLVILST